MGDNIIVEGSHDPEHDAARALSARGHTGRTTVDHKTGKPRMHFKTIQGTAKRTISEPASGGLHVRKWEPLPDARRR